MSIQKYQAFIKTIELGSLTKAAEHLQYTQSGISHMLNSLEEELGVNLLYRSRSGVQISSEGLELLPYLRDVCNSQVRLIEKVEDIHGVNCGTIRIGTFSSVSTAWLPTIIKSFQNKYRNVRFELVHGDYYEIENWIEEGRVDCGFLALPTKSKLETIFLKRDRFVAVLPAFHPLSKKDIFSIKDISTMTYIKSEDGEDNEVGKILDQHNIDVNAKFIVKDDATILSMVENGLGMSILAELCLERICYDIKGIPLDVEAYRDISIAFKDKEHLTEATKYFLDYVNEIK